MTTGLVPAVALESTGINIEMNTITPADSIEGDAFVGGGVTTTTMPSLDVLGQASIVIEPTRGPQNGDAESPSIRTGETEVAALWGSVACTEPPGDSLERGTSCLRGNWVTTKPSPGFVRFQVKGRRLVVRVVRSARIGGQPRQHLVRHMGSIQSNVITELNPRRRFWAVIDPRLAEFNPRPRAVFERAIADRIPRPTAAEEAAIRARILARRNQETAR